MMKKIERTPDKNPFRVPDGYFEEVNEKIISVATGKRDTARWSGISFRFRPYLLAAASIAGFILLSYTAMRVIAPRIINQHQSEILTEEYYEPYINDLDIYSLEEDAASLHVPVQGPDVSMADIIEYLLFDNIEINEIYEQL
jgi:hypothetical protein